MTRQGPSRLRALAGHHSVILQTDVRLKAQDFKTFAEFTAREGERISFVLRYRPSHLSPPKPLDPEDALRRTEEWCLRWIGQCSYEGPWAEAVRRSAITIKAMTYRPTGGTVAAPTTSLPEQHGGSRNWDYRFCWLRDAAFMVASLYRTGFHDEARAWRDWLLRTTAGKPSQLQPIYGIAGERRLNEWEVSWLPGFEQAKPVRVGNAASGQFQLDVLGEVFNALHLARHARIGAADAGWDLQKVLLDHLAKVWNEPDEGIWEVRGGPQHFVHSKVVAWVALDRAVKAVERFGLKGPVEQWRALRDAIHAEVCERGFDPQEGAFVQAFGSKHLDASTLVIPIVGFLPADDPRVRGTIAAIERELMQDGFVLRYEHDQDEGRTSARGGGLPRV